MKLYLNLKPITYKDITLYITHFTVFIQQLTKIKRLIISKLQIILHNPVIFCVIKSCHT